MAYWLVKSEPGAWSWDDHVKAGVAEWDGVRNHQAANNMRAMKIGERVFFYHSVTEKLICGVVDVVKEAYPDPTDDTSAVIMVDFKALFPVVRPVTLAEIKDEPTLKNLPLVRHTRLSVLPVSDEEWKLLCTMTETPA